MANRSSNLAERRSRQNRQSFVIILSVFAALFLIFIILFLFWRVMMPSSGSADTAESLTQNHSLIAEQIKKDVVFLADSIGQRNMHTPGTMDASVDFIRQRFESLGFIPETQNYTLRRGRYAGRSASNIIAEIPGSEKKDEIIVIGAHYDTVPHSPGANDNASGVAVLLSLAGELADSKPGRTIRFVAFANEEPPFFHTPDMGSYAYARRSREQNENITAMIALDGLGYFDDEPNSQSYPLPGLGFAYPGRAEFIGLVTRLRDLSLLREISAGFKEKELIPSESAALPGFLPGVNWSDHWAFWQHGYSAILITDTLLFRDPYYHTPSDTPERLSYENMARITSALVHAVMVLDSK
jgi:Zn-dependent M28 family amino/carboxypeptidase